MASLKLTGRPALSGVVAPCRYGARRNETDLVTIGERTGLAVAAITARRGKVSQAEEALAAFAQVRPLDRPGVVATDGVALIGVAPEQWLAVAEKHRAAGFVAAMAQACAAVASVTDQTSATVVLRLLGRRARKVLAKGCPIDLHPRVFQPGDAATTRIAHIDCTLWQVDATPTYDIAVDRSIAQSFWAWLGASAAEFGYVSLHPEPNGGVQD